MEAETGLIKNIFGFKTLTHINALFIQSLYYHQRHDFKVVVPALEHDYRHGFQHTLPKAEVSVKSIHGTMIVWLQNDQGYQRWGPTEVSLAQNS